MEKYKKLWTRVSVLIVPPTTLVLTKCPAYAFWTLIFGKDQVIGEVWGWSDRKDVEKHGRPGIEELPPMIV